MRKFTIRTRIMLMLLFVSIMACAVLGLMGSRYGQKAISKEVADQLNLVLSSKKDQITSYLEDTGHFVEVIGQNKMVIEAAYEFNDAFAKLNLEKLDSECSAALSTHYTKFMDSLSSNMNIKKDQALFYPNTLEGCYLQFEYIVNNPNPLGEKDEFYSAKDGSTYSDVHKKYHSYFKLLIEKYNFYDVFLVDLQTGDIVYSVFKETDFATNLYIGPYRSSNFANLVRSLQTNSDIQTASWMDFAPYRPSYGAPAAFVGIPLIDQGETVGGLVFQLPIAEINRVMTSNQNWEKDGLGKTGEVILVGDDRYMRSVSRFFLQDTLGYRNLLSAKGELQKDIDKMYRYGSTVLQQRVRTDALELGLEGKSGIIYDADYRGVEVIREYSPLDFKGFDWVIMSKKDIKESFFSVREFQKSMFVQTLVLILIITVLSLIMSSRFVEPIEKLTAAAKKMLEGDTTHRVSIESKDEFGVLGTTLNTVIEKLDRQKVAINQQLKYNEELLKNFVPVDFITRIKNGEKAFADEYQNVSLIAIDIIGFGELTAKIGAKESVNILNELVAAFDASASKNSIEKLRTVGDTYFGACGLFEPRLDHTKRIIQYAKEAKQLLGQINLNRQLHLDIQISTHSGSVIAGIVGEERFSFDVWGQTVNQLFTANELDVKGAIMASEAIVVRLKDFYKFTKLDKITKRGDAVYILKEG